MLLTVVDVAAFPPEPPSATEVAPPYPCAPAPIIVILIEETPVLTVYEVVPTLM
jgi:hypothetical protein